MVGLIDCVVLNSVSDVISVISQRQVHHPYFSRVPVYMSYIQYTFFKPLSTSPYNNRLNNGQWRGLYESQ